MGAGEDTVGTPCEGSHAPNLLQTGNIKISGIARYLILNHVICMKFPKRSKETSLGPKMYLLRDSGPKRSKEISLGPKRSLLRDDGRKRSKETSLGAKRSL